jgi:hypothetical protein
MGCLSTSPRNADVVQDLVELCKLPEITFFEFAQFIECVSSCSFLLGKSLQLIHGGADNKTNKNEQNKKMHCA